jgi:hypothetical protein
MSACVDCGASTGKRYGRYCDAHRWRHRGKPSTYRLTPERATYLREHYRPSERGVSSRCAAVLGVPKWRVCRWAAELGLTGPGKQGPNWTAQEDAFLEKHLTARHVNWIAQRLGRSITAVLVRAKRIRLSRLPDGYSQTDVALAFGVSRDTVERWQRQGWLHASFEPAKGQPHRVTDADMLRFVHEHRAAFALAKVDQVWFLDLVLSADKSREKVA